MTEQHIHIEKWAVPVQMTDEAYFAYSTDPRYARKIATETTTPPSPEQWAEYARVKAAWDIVKDSEFFELDGYDASAEVYPPVAQVEYIYAETHDEWLARCRALRVESPISTGAERLVRMFEGALIPASTWMVDGE